MLGRCVNVPFLLKLLVDSCLGVYIESGLPALPSGLWSLTAAMGFGVLAVPSASGSPSKLASCPVMSSSFLRYFLAF